METGVLLSCIDEKSKRALRGPASSSSTSQTHALSKPANAYMWEWGSQMIECLYLSDEKAMKTHIVLFGMQGVDTCSGNFRGREICSKSLRGH